MTPPKMLQILTGLALERKAERLTIAAFPQAIAAFQQAMTEFGIPPHPGGKCPAPDCGCKDAAGAVEARAVQIIEAELGHKLPAEGGGSG